jgi:hypothetical protein
MGFELTSRKDGTQFYVTSQIWDSLRETAKIYGWKPRGTSEPDYCNDSDFDCGDWLGDYETSNGQTVEKIDAAWLGVSLLMARRDGEPKSLPPRILEEFIAFLRKGAFIIW